MQLLRTPIHYAMCYEDRRIMSKLTSAAAYDNNLREAVRSELFVTETTNVIVLVFSFEHLQNNFSFIDYYNHLEHPVPAKKRPRGRREICYDVRIRLMPHAHV